VFSYLYHARQYGRKISLWCSRKYESCSPLRTSSRLFPGRLYAMFWKVLLVIFTASTIAVPVLRRSPSTREKLAILTYTVSIRRQEDGGTSCGEIPERSYAEKKAESMISRTRPRMTQPPYPSEKASIHINIFVVIGSSIRMLLNIGTILGTRRKQERNHATVAKNTIAGYISASVSCALCRNSSLSLRQCKKGSPPAYARLPTLTMLIKNSRKPAGTFQPVARTGR